MQKTKVTPKDFFLWVGAMISLYVGIFSFIRLFFDYIDYAYPDPLNPIYVQPYSSGMRFEIASLIVLFPVFFLLTYFIRRDITRTPGKAQIWIRRWALVTTLFLASVTIVIDLITLINYFLGAELTTRFILEVVVVLLVAAIVVMHFLADMWGYWSEYPSRARSVGIGVAVAVVAMIVSGFFIIGTPGEVRLYAFDDQKVNDLQEIQSQIVNYWQQEGKLPATLSELNNSISGFTVPTDPQSGQSYGYEIIKTATTTQTMTVQQLIAAYTSTFELCADFNAPTQPDSASGQYAPVPEEAGNAVSEDWTHGAGQTCFDRTIDPALYPVTSQKTQ